MNHLSKMMERVRKIDTGLGVQHILEEAYVILGNPIAMFNTEYSLLAYTEVITDDPIWNELVTTGTFSKETQKFFGNEGFVEELANASKYTFMKSEKLKYDRITGKLFIKNNSYVSNLVIVACNKPFDEQSDPIVFENICKLISRNISKNEHFQEYEQTHMESVVGNLIDEDYDLKSDTGQVGIIYDSLESNLYVVVVDISLSDPEYSDIVYYRNLLMQTEPSYKYTIYSKYIVIIVSTDDDNLNANKELSELIKIFCQNDMYAGISSRFENLFELRKYYAQALDAMKYALKIRCDQRIFPCCEESLDKMEQIEALANGAGIQYFLNVGAKIFGNPILFHDMELNLLGYSEDVEISDPIWQELIIYGTSSYETIDLFRTEGFVDLMDNIKGGAFLISEKIKYDRISWRIYSNDNIRIGCTSIVNSMKPFSEDELLLFGVFSQKFSKEVGKIEFYNNYGQIYSGTIINRLLSGKIDDYTFYSEDIGNLYNNLMDNLYLAVVDTTKSERESVGLSFFRGLFNWEGTVNRYAVFEDRIIIIISINGAPLNEKDEFNNIGKAFEQNNIYAGISSRFGDIYDLQKYYFEAVDALNSGIKNNDNNSKQRIFQYNDGDG